jgi:signal transduction histidine kinase
MSHSVERYAGDLSVLYRFVEALAQARSPEEVFTSGLNAVHEIFAPDRAFVVMPDAKPARQEKNTISYETGSASTLTIPVVANNQFAGKFILQFERHRTFSDRELELAAILALQSGLVVATVHGQRMRAELVAMAAHELRAPLTAILGGALLIKSGKAATRALDMIERNIRLQEKLIEELLHISQIDAGRIVLQMEKVDLAPLLNEVVDEIQTSATDDGTVIRSDLESPLVVKGDPQRLRQIFSNLLGNSVRCASPHGEVRLRAFMSEGFVQCSIVDNGIGISAENLPHIFERFRQVPSSHVRSHSGCGLGLSIVHDLVTMQGGTVTAESPGVGQGARFCVKLFAAS